MPVLSVSCYTRPRAQRIQNEPVWISLAEKAAIDEAANPSKLTKKVEDLVIDAIAGAPSTAKRKYEHGSGGGGGGGSGGGGGGRPNNYNSPGTPRYSNAKRGGGDYNRDYNRDSNNGDRRDSGGKRDNDRDRDRR